MKKVLIIILSFYSLSFQIIYGCSAFLLKGEDYCVVGFNENWKTMPGMVVINKRNIYNESLSWKSLTSSENVDEKGLFIVELSLDINDDYVEKGFPIGYVNDDFPDSGEFDNIKINLREYMSILTEQQK
jgi:hypothetical protein